MRITVSSGACAAIPLFQAGPLAEQVGLRPFPRAALLNNPSLQGRAGHMVDLSGGDHFEYSRERWLRQAYGPFLFGLDNEQVRRVERARSLNIDAVPPSVRISHGDGTPAHQ